MKIKQFDVWTADLNPQIGTEPGKIRPVLIVQTDLLNSLHPSTSICPVTTNVVKESDILRVHIKKGIANMQKLNRQTIFLFIGLLIFPVLLLTCNKDDSDSKYDINTLGTPKFVDNDFIDLSKVTRISKFRSGVGHDYSDIFESCRSMKHYYSLDTSWEPTNDFTSNIYSPVKGNILKIETENNGANYQIWIRPDDFSAFTIILFHVTLTNSIKEGIKLNADQIIGTVSGNTDIAVQVNTTEGIKYISYFDIMTDSIFSHYQNRGLSNRGDIIISKEIRDANPIKCNGEDQFPNQYETRNYDWVFLN